MRNQRAWKSIRTSSVALLALLLAVGVAHAQSHGDLPAATAALVDGIDAAASSVGWETLRADYVIESRSVVESRDYPFSLWGRIDVRRLPDGLELVNREYLSEDRRVASRVDRFVDGELYSYHPLTQYAQRIPPSSLGKDKTRFGKYWLPLVTFLSPREGLAAAAPLAVETPGEWPGGRYALTHDFDQLAELERLTRGARLEYWGPPGDPSFVVDAFDRVIGREVRYVRRERSSGDQPPRMQVGKWTRAELSDIRVVDGVPVPRTINYRTRLPRYSAAHFSAVVSLSNVVVDAPWASPTTPEVPSDVVYLCAEKPRPERIPQDDDLAAAIMAADYSFGTDDESRGRAIVADLEAKILGGERRPSPYEVSHLARLYGFTERPGRGFELHRRTIEGLKVDFRKGRLDPMSQAEFERVLSRYLIEFAHFQARLGDPEWDAGREAREARAASYLERQLAQLSEVTAIVRIAGRAADHHAQAGDYPAAQNVLDRAATRLGGDVSAEAWLAASREKVAVHRSERARAEAIRAKNKRISTLRRALRREDGPSAVTERGELEEELRRLLSNP